MIASHQSNVSEPVSYTHLITEAGEKVLITAEHEIGIKGISITIECSTRSIKVKGSREYKYPITDKAVEEFQEEMLSKYPGYSIYVSGQMLSCLLYTSRCV